jgi:hypothetical protein
MPSQLQSLELPGHENRTNCFLTRILRGGAGREAEGVRGGAAGGAGEQVGGGAGQNARNPTLSLSGPPMPALYNATPGLNPQ